MTTLLNSFEGGSNGVTITTANSGGTSGSAFDATSTGSGATTAYSSTHAAHGALSCQIATGVTSTTSWVGWTTSMGTQTQVWARVYGYFTANPAANMRFVQYLQGVTKCGQVQVKPTGALQFEDSAAVAQLTSVLTIPLNAWWRLECMMTGSATVGQWQFRLFTTNPDGTVPDETQTSAASLNTTGAMNAYRFGLGVSAASAGPYWMDDTGLSNTGYLGPIVPAATAHRSTSIVPHLIAAGVLA